MATDVIAEPPPDPDLLVQPRGEAATEDAVGHLHRIAGGIVPAYGTASDGDRRLLKAGNVDQHHLATGRRTRCDCRRERGAGPGPAGKVPLRKAEDRLGIDIAGDHQHRIVRSINCIVLTDDVLARDAGERRGIALLGPPVSPGPEDQPRDGGVDGGVHVVKGLRGPVQSPHTRPLEPRLVYRALSNGLGQDRQNLPWVRQTGYAEGRGLLIHAGPICVPQPGKNGVWRTPTGALRAKRRGQGRETLAAGRIQGRPAPESDQHRDQGEFTGARNDHPQPVREHPLGGDRSPMRGGTRRRRREVFWPPWIRNARLRALGPGGGAVGAQGGRRDRSGSLGGAIP